MKIISKSKLFVITLLALLSSATAAPLDTVSWTTSSASTGVRPDFRATW